VRWRAGRIYSRKNTVNPPNYPQVALDFMNRDHAEFAALRQKLLDLLAGEVSTPTVDGALAELGEHTRRHFSDEEQVMRETGFPVYEIHTGEHDRVLAEITMQVERWMQGRDAPALRDWLDRAVGTWLVEHVSSMDFVTAAFAEKKLRKA
jgi:hemerythrin